MNKLVNSFIVFLLIVVGGGSFYLLSKNPISVPTKKETPVQKIIPKENNAEVLGNYINKPRIYVSGGKDERGAGGVISLSSYDEPAVQIGSYNSSGNAEIAIYQSSIDDLLNYLTHDSENKQIKKTFDVNKLNYVTTINQQISSGYNSDVKTVLPISDNGVWLLSVRLNGVTENSFVIRSNYGVLTKEGDNELIFWAQDFKTGKSIGEGEIKIYSLLDKVNELKSTNIGTDGIGKIPFVSDIDVAVGKIKDQFTIIPLNLQYLNGSTYESFQPKIQQTEYFIFTDRPIYKPGDTIYFKSVIRDENDVRYSIPNGLATVKIYTDYSEKNIVFEKNLPISSEGTITGEFKLPDDAKTGSYNLKVSTSNVKENNYWYPNTVSFQVEYYRKPEYSIDITIPQSEYIAGDNANFTIFGNYFSGEPLANQKVKYNIYSGDYYEYQYLTDLDSVFSGDYRYGYWSGSQIEKEKEVTLDKNGKIDVPLKTILNKTKSQVVTISVQVDNGSGNPSFASKNILIRPGDFGIYRKSYGANYSQINSKIQLPLALKPIVGKSVDNISLDVKIHRENWISYQVPEQKYPSYKKEEEDLPPVSLVSDSQGNTTIEMTPNKVGSYTFTVSGKDKRGNTISKIFYWWVSEENIPFYYDAQNNDLTIKTDKDKYQPTDTVRFLLSSNIPDRDVFLSLERGRLNRYQIVHLSGKTANIDVPLVATDIPNIFAKISSFSTTSINTNSLNVIVSADTKKLKISLTPDKTKYNPKDTASINILTTDTKGNPISTDLALWAVDKAIFELAENNLGDIFKNFWYERYDATRDTHSLVGITVLMAEQGGGCFGAGTKILMADNFQKNIEKVQVNNIVKTFDPETKKSVNAKVLNVHKATVNGFLIVNSNLKVTPDHKMLINNIWQEAGNIQIGDKLLDSNGKLIIVSSLEWQLGKTDSYNLTTEKYHTFIANNVLVHNQKGGGTRSVFKDTAYWNPSIKTDSNGQAKVSFVLPDNLTTWTVAAVAATVDVKVGQSTLEMQVAKDISVRPVLPNILRLGDKIVLSALVQNSSNQNQTFTVNLSFDSGNIEKDATKSGVVINSKETKQLYWTVIPKKENEKAKLTFSAISTENDKNSDTIISEIPVQPFGFYDKIVEVGSGDKNFILTLNPKANKEKSDIKLSFASSLINTLPSALDYLIGYPYGCVEQTTSRFVPAILAKENSIFLKDYIEGKNLDDMIKKGILRLKSLQQSDGGWSWWSSGRSDPFVSGYVFEYLVKAKNLGSNVDTEMLQRAQTYLEQEQYFDAEKQNTVRYFPEAVVMKTYALSLVESSKWKEKITNFSVLSPDLMALSVLANVNNGDKNPQTNGLSLLLSNMKAQGEEVYWEKGDKIRFGSVDVSTALSIRAILASGGDRVVAEKAIRYVNKNRKYDYWSNTFGTVQVLRAIIEFSKNENELTPNYTYTVTQDKVNLKSETITTPNQKIQDITIPFKSLKNNTSEIGVSMIGQGQLYSTLTKREFIDEINTPFLNHGLTIKREYISEKGDEYSLSVGDTVSVKLTVNGLLTKENYGIIKDELPSGLVPINIDMKNEQYNQTSMYYKYDYYHNIFDREYTQNGAILSLYEISPGQNVYEYKARVVSEGEFIVPPVEVSLMYLPEIFGRSEVQRVKTTKTPEIIPGKALKKTLTSSSQVTKIIIAVFLTGIGVLLVIMVFVALKRKQNKKETDDVIPPPSTP